jgi:antitoxin component YwqK of YwqJK toxin-antitoxin module
MMIRIKFFIVIIVLTLYSCNHSNVILEQWSNGSPKIVLDFKNIQDSIYTRIEYFENGKIKSTQDYVNAKLNGKVISYSDKGFKQQEVDYVNGEKNGIGSGWYESGKIAFQFKYKDGLYYDGTEYFENGWPRVLVKFSAPGKRQGKAIYYDEDGNIWQQGYFENDKEDSVWVRFDKTGRIIQKITYKDGEKMKDE